MFSNISFTTGMLLGMSYPTGKTTHTGTGMGKNLNPHAGMGFLAGRVRVSGCRYGMALPDGFLPVAISTYRFAVGFLLKTRCDNSLRTIVDGEFLSTYP
jgi:hypothetical protein